MQKIPILVVVTAAALVRVLVPGYAQESPPAQPAESRPQFEAD